MLPPAFTIKKVHCPSGCKIERLTHLIAAGTSLHWWCRSVAIVEQVVFDDCIRIRKKEFSVRKQNVL